MTRCALRVAQCALLLMVLAGAADAQLVPHDSWRTIATEHFRVHFTSPLEAAAQRAASQAELAWQRLSAELRGRAPAGRHLQWIKASVGSTVRLIPVEQVHFLRSDEKYTLVVWDGGEALIRKTIRELADELDPERYVQIHRSVIVNLARVTHVTRGLNETADVHLEGRSDTLPVSRSFLHLFRQM